VGVELSPTVRAAVTAGHLAHLVTIEPEGTPHVTIVWVGLDGDEIVCGHLGKMRKVSNIKRNPSVALSMETGGPAIGGQAEYLIVYGKARVTEGGAPELLDKLAKVYLGDGVAFANTGYSEPGYVTRITVDKVAGVGPWRD
jgi:PPOX class probable F420-dependent enzyme